MKGAMGLLILVIAGILGYEVISGHAADLINAFRGNTATNTSQGTSNTVTPSPPTGVTGNQKPVNKPS